jgi:hypothetical protein
MRPGMVVKRPPTLVEDAGEQPGRLSESCAMLKRWNQLRAASTSCSLRLDDEVEPHEER